MARRNVQSRKNKMSKYQVPLRAAGTVLIVDVIVIAIALLAVGGEPGRIFLQMVLFPLAAFVSGFFALVATRHVVVCLLSSIAIHTLLYWIALGLSGGMILWILLYLLSSFVGLSIAYIVLTHRS